MGTFRHSKYSSPYGRGKNGMKMNGGAVSVGMNGQSYTYSGANKDAASPAKIASLIKTFEGDYPRINIDKGYGRNQPWGDRRLADRVAMGQYAKGGVFERPYSPGSHLFNKSEYSFADGGLFDDPGTPVKKIDQSKIPFLQKGDLQTTFKNLGINDSTAYTGMRPIISQDLQFPGVEHTGNYLGPVTGVNDDSNVPRGPGDYQKSPVMAGQEYQKMLSNIKSSPYSEKYSVDPKKGGAADFLGGDFNMFTNKQTGQNFYDPGDATYRLRRQGAPQHRKALPAGMVYGPNIDDLTGRQSIDEFKGGGAFHINPAHKGWCTPMSKSTCTGRRRAFALTMKKHHGFHKQSE